MWISLCVLLHMYVWDDAPHFIISTRARERLASFGILVVINQLIEKPDSGIRIEKCFACDIIKPDLGHSSPLLTMTLHCLAAPLSSVH